MDTDMKPTPVSALDVAAYILEQRGDMTSMKLQKLVYYCQAWGLVWDEAPLFSENIEAWVNGPVVRELYNAHKGLFHVSKGVIHGDLSRLSKDQQETVQGVLQHYGDKSSKYLIDLTHAEDPWLIARREAGLGPTERGEAEISHAAMAEYYGAL